jgi:hypothetical protein
VHTGHAEARHRATSEAHASCDSKNVVVTKQFSH